MAAVRASFAVPAAAEPFASPPGSSEEEETVSWAPQDGAARPRPALRVRRPAAAQVPPPAGAAAAPQQPAGPQQHAAPPPFMFGTPGAGLTGSAVKARRAKGRSPAGAAAPSPAFTTSSAASMAWSPYPSSTDGASAATPQPPSAATPTSGAAPIAAVGSESPADSVAADLQARLNLEGRGSAAPPHQGAAVQPPAASQGEPLPGAGQQAAAPFSFVFGAAASAPSAHAGRAAFRQQSPTSSPGVAKASPRAFAPAAAAPAAASEASQFGAQPSAASEGSTAAGPAANASRPSSAAAAEQQAAAGPFVFGTAAAAGSPAARMRPRSRSHSVSPQQPAHAGWGAAGAAAAAAAAAAMPAAPAPEGAGAAAFEPMQENHQQQAQQPAPAAQQGVFAPKQPAVGSPTAFTAAGTAARRPPGSRRKAAHPARSSTGMGTRSRQGSQEHEAAPPLAPTGSAAPVPLAGAPVQAEAAAGPAAGSGELDAQSKKAYSCSEMYRSQGNEAFRDSNYTAAYDLYTKALHALWPYPALHARLALLLSNRAAALLSQGKPLSALADCQMGLKYDPGLMRCALRVATCHSRMGNFDEAFQFVANLRSTAAGNAEQLREIEPKQRDLEEQERQLYEALRSLGHNLSAPRRDPATGAEAETLSRAPSGTSVHRAASGGANMSRASSAASVAGAAAPQAPATAEAFWDALKKVDDIAPHVPHSELLLAAKAEGLLRLGKHERAREFCGQAVHLDDGAHREAQKRAPWRLWVQAQCSWQEGDARGGLKGQLQALLAALEAQQAQQASASGSGGGAAAAAAGSAFFPAPASAGASTSGAARQETRRAEQLAAIVGLPSCENVKGLLEGLEAADKLRLAGNAAVKAGKAAEAVAKYSEALQASGLSPAIMAVLLSNRAAAHQHLKQRAQAIADCCRAIALNPHYAKAQSRLATLLSELGYHSDAASALEAAAAAPGISAADRKEYQSRMASEQAAAKRASSRRGLGGSQAALDHYKLLGLERSVTSDEVRRTYKKLALQLHPDKAASAVRLAPRCAGCGSAPFEALAAQGRLQERATWLFKLLGEASDVLSDASKRRELDHALRAAAGGSGFGSRGGFSSYYGDSDDDVSDIYNSFNNMFGGRRPAGSSGSRAGSYGSGYPGTGAGFGSYGAYGAHGQRGGSSGSGARNWGFF